MLRVLLAQYPALSEPSVKLDIIINNSSVATYGIKYIKQIIINWMKSGKGSNERFQKDLA